MTGLLMLALLGAQEQPRSVFRTEVRQVYLDVFVEKNGAPVVGLSAQDFEVLDDGVVQHGIRLLDLKNHPLSAVLLLDTSVSVRGAELEELEQAARTFRDGLTPSDEIGVMQFGTHYQLRQSLTRVGELETAAGPIVDIMTSGGATALHDSVQAATSLVETGTGRPLVVVFSDGDDNSSWLTLDDLTDMARQSFAVIYAVRKTPDGVRARASGSRGGDVVEHGSGLREKRRLEDVVTAGGGRLIALAPGGNVSEAFALVLQEMRSRYLLVFEPSADAAPGWHGLEVRLPGDEDASLRNRAGYVLR